MKLGSIANSGGNWRAHPCDRAPNHGLPAEAIDETPEEAYGREIPVEARCRTVDPDDARTARQPRGLAFVANFDRYLRLLDCPCSDVCRWFATLLRTAKRAPPKPALRPQTTLGHHYAGWTSFTSSPTCTDVSPPVFLDRLGATLVNATRTPAKRLLWLGSAFLTLFVVVNALAFLKPLRGIIDKLQKPDGLAGDHLGRCLRGLLVPGCVVPQDCQPICRFL